MIIEKNIAIEKIATDDRLAVHSRLESIEDLAKSIEQHGLLQPVLVTLDRTCESAESYLLLDGHRRLAAAKALEHKAIRASVIAENPGNDSDFSEAVDDPKSAKELCKTFAVNLLRKKVAYEKLEAAVLALHDQGWGYKKIAEKIGYSKAGIQKIINRAKRKDAPLLVETQKELSLLKRTNTMLSGLIELQFDSQIYVAIQQVKNALEKRMEEIKTSDHQGEANLEVNEYGKKSAVHC